jgi:hypothetical protein
MVYGLNVQPEWGYYPKVETLDGDLSKASAIITPDGGVGTGGFPRETESLPKRVKWMDPNGNPVPDFDQTPRLNVSERAKQLIESLEPGVHQFIPVEYFDKKGKFLENRYWFVVCNRIDSLDREHTTMVLSPGLGWYSARNLVAIGVEIPPHIDPDQPAKLVFNLAQIGDAQLWHDKFLGSGEFISDKLAEAFLAAGITGLRLAESRGEAV